MKNSLSINTIFVVPQNVFFLFHFFGERDIFSKKKKINILSDEKRKSFQQNYTVFHCFIPLQKSNDGTSLGSTTIKEKGKQEINYRGGKGKINHAAHLDYETFNATYTSTNVKQSRICVPACLCTHQAETESPLIIKFGTKNQKFLGIPR